MSDEDFASIQTIEDMDTEVYIRLQNELDRMRKLKSVRYLYAAGRNADGTLVYLVDGLDLDAEDFAYPGTAIEEGMIPYLEDALSGKVSYSQSIMDTTWGAYHFCLLPGIQQAKPGRDYRRALYNENQDNSPASVTHGYYSLSHLTN